MSVKIKVSYEHPEELAKILRLLRPVIRSTRISKAQEGRYKRAYVCLMSDEQRTKLEGSEKNVREMFRY